MYKPAKTGTLSTRPPQRIPVHITGQDVPDSPCELVGIDAGMIFVRSERQMAKSSSVAISLDQMQLSGVVAGCQPNETDWVIGIALSSRKRRLAERIPNGLEATIGIVEGDETSLHPCAIIDSTPFGLGLRLRSAIQSGAHVCVETDSGMILGEIKHCHPRLDGQFVAGVLILDVVPDSRTESRFSVMLNNLRWKLNSTIRGREVHAFPADR